MGEFKQEQKIDLPSGAPRVESGRLFLELRIPKVDHEGDPGGGAGGETLTAKDLMVACGLCGKTFRSKKALNGHMRVHVQNHWESTKKKFWELAAEVRRASSTLLAKGYSPKCVVCGRMFPSMNALYGHMRSHPGRSWRGVQHPVTVVKPEPVIDFDLFTPVIAGWSVTGKRGRRCISSVDSGSSLHSEDEDLSIPEKGLEEKDNIYCVKGETRETEKCAAVSVESYLIPEKHQNDQDIKTEEAGSENPHTVPDSQRLQNRAIKRKVRELNKIIGDHSIVGCISTDKYYCKICNKSFTSPQALGGHRSSCNKSKQRSGRAAPSLQPQTAFSEATTVEQVAATDHFSQLFSRLCSSNNAMADFDLNELPSMEESEDEEEPKPNAEVGCGFDDASMPKPALVMGLSI